MSSVPLMVPEEEILVGERRMNTSKGSQQSHKDSKAIKSRPVSNHQSMKRGQLAWFPGRISL